MELINNILNWIQTNLPSFIATTGSILTILTGIVLIIRKGQELFGIGNRLVNTVVSAFTDVVNKLFGNVNSLITGMKNDVTGMMISMRKEFNEQLQIAQNDIKTSMEITTMVVLAKSVSPALKQELVNKANNFKNNDLKQYVVDMVKVDKPMSESVQLAEVKEIVPTDLIELNKVDLSKNGKSIKPYVPSSE